VTLPYRLRHTRGGGVDEYVVRNVTPAQDDPETYRSLPDGPRDISFARGGSRPMDIMRAPSGHLFVRPRVGGRDVGWFAFDTVTGAGMSIAPAVADALNMPAFGEVVRVGAGHTMHSWLRQGARFDLGGASVADSVYAELPIEFVALMQQQFGIELAGACGYDFLGRVVAELHLRDLTLTLHDPAAYDLKEATWRELRFNRKFPCVHCAFEDRDGLFSSTRVRGRLC
jgi:hypothetical protein